MLRRVHPFAITAWVAVALLGSLPAAQAQEYFDAYGLMAESPALDLGVQPLGYPSGVISAVMAHDRMLRKALEPLGRPLRTHPFQRGADMLGLLSQKKLEAGLLGDMPTLLTTAGGNAWIVGLVKQTSTAIVARNVTQVRDLAGKRIAYAELSSAHHTLLQGLTAANLDESKVTLVPMRVDAMPAALERGDVDAFAAWEPAPSIALSRSAANRIVFRGQSADYFVIERGFEKRNPEAALHLTASFIRAIEWMQRSQRNVEKAAQWALAEEQRFSGKASSASVAQVVAITRREILDIPSAPAIPMAQDTLPLRKEYDFLAKLGKLPQRAQWAHVESALGYEGIHRVLADQRRFPTKTFDYDD